MARIGFALASLCVLALTAAQDFSSEHEIGRTLLAREVPPENPKGLAIKAFRVSRDNASNIEGDVLFWSFTVVGYPRVQFLKVSAFSDVNDDGVNASASLNLSVTALKFGFLKLIEFYDNGTQPCWDNQDQIIQTYSLVDSGESWNFTSPESMPPDGNATDATSMRWCFNRTVVGSPVMSNMSNSSNITVPGNGTVIPGGNITNSTNGTIVPFDFIDPLINGTNFTNGTWGNWTNSTNSTGDNNGTTTGGTIEICLSIAPNPGTPARNGVLLGPNYLKIDVNAMNFVYAAEGTTIGIVAVLRGTTVELDSTNGISIPSGAFLQWNESVLRLDDNSVCPLLNTSLLNETDVMEGDMPLLAGEDDNDLTSGETTYRMVFCVNCTDKASSWSWDPEIGVIERADNVTFPVPNATNGTFPVPNITVNGTNPDVPTSDAFSVAHSSAVFTMAAAFVLSAVFAF